MQRYFDNFFFFCKKCYLITLFLYFLCRFSVKAQNRRGSKHPLTAQGQASVDSCDVSEWSQPAGHVGPRDSLVTSYLLVNLREGCMALGHVWPSQKICSFLWSLTRAAAADK